MTALNHSSFAAGHFELSIDGHKATTFLKSCDGGWAKANVADDPIGAQSGRVKHLSTIEIEPLSFELGLAGSTQVLQWIQGSWNRKWARRNGQITHADFNLKQTFEHWFYDALMVETTFPTLDANSKETAYLKCKIQPERVQTKSLQGSGTQIAGQYSPKQKLWLSSAFRFGIDQFDGMEYTNKLESFTIKQGTKKMFTGADRFPQIEPTNIQFPNLTGTVSLAHADRLLKWHHDYVYSEKATKDIKAQLSGCIEFLSPDRKQTIFRINLSQVGLMSASIQQATANTDQIKRAKFEMFVGSMELDGAGALGLE
jgi:T4-like virus tail tube protein gp19